MIKKIALLAVLLTFPASLALADGMAFEPTMPSTLPSKTVAAKTPVTTSAVKPVTTVSQSIFQENEIPLENKKFQNALTELDAAQIDIRTNLIDYKTKYTEVDNRYKAVKEERKVTKKLVKSTEKKIKNIEKQKEAIRKNML